VIIVLLTRCACAGINKVCVVCLYSRPKLIVKLAVVKNGVLFIDGKFKIDTTKVQWYSYILGGFETFSDPGAKGPYPLGYSEYLLLKS